jgi:hypothetical protein
VALVIAAYGTVGGATLAYEYDDATDLVTRLIVVASDNSPVTITIKSAAGVVRGSRTWAAGEHAALTVSGLTLNRLLNPRGRIAPVIEMSSGA